MFVRCLILTASLVSVPAFAQDEEEPKVVYKSRTEIDFEGVEVDGELVKPQGALLLDRKRANFKSPSAPLYPSLTLSTPKAPSLLRGHSIPPVHIPTPPFPSSFD